MAHRGKQKPKQKKRDKLDSRVRAIASQIVSEIQEPSRTLGMLRVTK